MLDMIYLSVLYSLAYFIAYCQCCFKETTWLDLA